MTVKKNITESYFEDELTRYGFISHMEAYMKQLLSNPKKAEVDDYLKSHGIDNEKALKLLLKRPDPHNVESAVLVKNTKIKTGEDGKDIFSITYKIPREGYKKKMRNLYINCFESNIVEGCPINEELNYYEHQLSSTPSPFKSGEKIISQCKPGSTGDRWAKHVNDNNNAYVPHMFSNEEQMVKDIEAMDKDKAYAKRGGLNKKINETDCASCMQGGGNNPEEGQYIGNALKNKKNKPDVMRRTIYMTEAQVEYLKQNVDEATAGDIGQGYTVPFGVKGSDETMNHQNICSDKNLMKGGVTGVKV